MEMSDLYFFDTHAHLTSKELVSSFDRLAERAQWVGVKRIANICTDEKSLQEALLLQKNYPWIYHTAATTPHDVEKEGESFFPFVEKAASEGLLAAIGETGLDYFYEDANPGVQKEFLKRYMALATRLQLPLIFHCRNAFSDLFDMADAEYKERPAILHCFTGAMEEAREVFNRGWLLSVSGIATYPKSERLREVVRYAPLDSLVVETDSPYLAPQGKRGKQNEPSFLPEVVHLISAIKGVSVDTVATHTFQNAENFFSLSKQR